jgi:hypothetical protein
MKKILWTMRTSTSRSLNNVCSPYKISYINLLQGILIDNTNLTTCKNTTSKQLMEKVMLISERNFKLW